MKMHAVAVLLVFVGLTSLCASQVHPERVRVGQNVMSAQIVTKVAPVYPPLAKQARIQGAVVLKVRINKSGDVTDIQLYSGHPMLAPAAIEAVKQWKYRPYLLNGEAVDVETDVTVNFTLADKPAAEGVAGDTPGGVPAGPLYGVVGTVSSNPGDPAHPPKLVRVSSTVMQGLSVTKVQPEYPAEARDQRIQGEVRLDVTVDKEGNVSDIKLISGHPSLAPSAIEAVKQWKYRPYQLSGNPLAMESLVVVNFTLAD
jgi:TonB family protein